MAACRQAFTLLGAGLLLLCRRFLRKQLPSERPTSSRAEFLARCVSAVSSEGCQFNLIRNATVSVGTIPRASVVEGTSADSLARSSGRGPLTLKMTCEDLFASTLPFQPVEVYANDQKLRMGGFESAAFTAEIPAE